VLTLVGNRPEWVAAMVACFRQGFVVLPCTEQLRPADLRLRLEATRPVAVVCDPRNRAVLEAAGCAVAVLWDERAPAPPPADLGADDACLITFTSGTRRAQAGRARPALPRRPGPAGRALARRPPRRARVVHGASAGRRARATPSSPRGCAAPARLLHDARFDPHERLELLERERPQVLCMAADGVPPSSPSAPSPHPVAGLRGSSPRARPWTRRSCAPWHEATGLWIRDGYGQTETGQLTGMPLGGARPGSMGRPLPGVRLWVADGELCADPRTVPTFCRGVLGAAPIDRSAPWRTGRPGARGGRVPLLRGPHGRRHHLQRLPDRAVRGRVGARGPPRRGRGRGGGGARRRARLGRARGRRAARRAAAGDALARELQEHVKARTAPYKYPRVVEFAAELPKTASGKVRRAALRQRQR
jgi:acetyl-CoA synthetase